MTPEQTKAIIAAVYSLYVSEGTPRQNKKLTDFVETLIPELNLQDVKQEIDFVPGWIRDEYPDLEIKEI